MAEAGVARAKKKALKEGRILVFIDESGLRQRPHRCRTWAPRGQTPILQYNFNWKTLSVAAGLTLWNFYFRIYAGAIKKEQVVDFLAALVRHLHQPLLIVWDRLPAHRSHLVHGIVIVNIMFRVCIADCRRVPVRIQGRTDLFLLHRLL